MRANGDWCQGSSTFRRAPRLSLNGDMADLTELLDRVRARHDLPPPRTRRAIREEAGASQQECADVLGVSRQGFAHWEAGTRNPAGDHLTAYLELLRSLRSAVAA